MKDRCALRFAPVLTALELRLKWLTESNKLVAILEPFQQVQGAVERACDGLGLGLTVAYRITQMIGGTLLIESELGAGTTVKLKLPSRNKQANTGDPTARFYG
jgi:signal transduction histidine kinase